MTRRGIRRVSVLLAGLIVAGGAVYAAFDFVRVDRCLDQGGAWHSDRCVGATDDE